MIPFLRVFLTTFLKAVVNPLFLGMLFFNFIYYSKLAKFEKRTYGRQLYPVTARILSSVKAGAAAGVFLSFFTVFLGIRLTERTGLLFMIPITLFLIMIKVRYICFSYSGGILCLLSLFFGAPQADVFTILFLIGLLHVTEGVLVLVDGKTGKLPVYVKQKGYGTVGGFQFVRSWPIPFLTLMMTAGTSYDLFLKMPFWWPLLKTGGITFMMIPVVSNLTFSEVRIGEEKKSVRVSFLKLAGYGILLCSVAYLGKYDRTFWYIGSVFSCLGHEIIVAMAKREIPAYQMPGEGLLVLYVYEGSLGKQAGIRPGDRITRINGKRIFSRKELEKCLKPLPERVSLEVNQRQVTIIGGEEGIRSLGLLFAPEKEEKETITVSEDRGLFFYISAMLKKKI